VRPLPLGPWREHSATGVHGPRGVGLRRTARDAKGGLHRVEAELHERVALAIEEQCPTALDVLERDLWPRRDRAGGLEAHFDLRRPREDDRAIDHMVLQVGEPRIAQILLPARPRQAESAPE